MISAPLKRLRDEEIILQIGERGIAKHYPCPDFFAACAPAQACVVCDDALRANAALLFARKVSAMRVWASRARRNEQ